MKRWIHATTDEKSDIKSKFNQLVTALKEHGIEMYPLGKRVDSARNAIYFRLEFLDYMNNNNEAVKDAFNNYRSAVDNSWIEEDFDSYQAYHGDSSITDHINAVIEDCFPNADISTKASGNDGQLSIKYKISF